MNRQFKLTESMIERIRWILLIFASLVLGSSVLFIVLERIFLPQAWYPYGMGSLLEVVGQTPIEFETDNEISIRSRKWDVQITEAIALKFSAQVRQKIVKDLWATSMPSLLPVWIEDLSGGYTRVNTPFGADPYVYRSVRTLLPIASRRFRVEVQMRSRQEIGATGCRGIWLQENGGTYSSQCFPVALTKEWQTFRFEWVAPKAAQTASLRVVLNDFDGLEYDVRNLVLQQQWGSSWQTLLPFEPTGAVMWLDWASRNKTVPQPNVALNPDGLWREYNIPVNLPAATQITALLWLETNMRVALKDVRWEAQRQSTPPDAVSVLTRPFRSAVWFSNPNYAGHSLVAFTLLILFLLPRGRHSIWIGVISSLVGVIGVYFTESRAAWLALGLGLPCLLGLSFSGAHRRWFWGILIAVCIVGILLGGTEMLGRLASVDQSEVTRQSIWRIAVVFITQHPWGGQLLSSFGEAYALAYPSVQEQVMHAHNFWLQMGVRFGVPGFVSSLIVTISLLILYWIRRRFTGTFFLLPLLLMNLLDYSLDYVGVLIPLLISLFWLVIVPKLDKVESRDIRVLDSTKVKNSGQTL